MRARLIRLALGLVVAAGLTACASDPSRLAPGTERAQVLQTLGQPTAQYRLSGQQNQFDNIHAQFPLADHPCADVPPRRVQRPTGYFQAQVATGMALTQQHLVRRQRVARGWRVWREVLCAVVT